MNLGNEAILDFFDTKLRTRRWFGEKLDYVSASIEDEIPLYTSGDVEIRCYIFNTKPGNHRYFVPLAITKSMFHIYSTGAPVHTLNGNTAQVVEAEYLDTFFNIIFNMFTGGERRTGRKSSIVFNPIVNLRGEHVRKGEVLGHDTTNINLRIIGDNRTFVLKTYRKIDLSNTEPDMLLKLSRSAFKHTPGIFGYAQIRSASGDAVCFLLMEYVNSAGDGIKAFMKDMNFLINARKSDEQREIYTHSGNLAWELGRITAEMHAHLVDETGAFRAEEVTPEDIERWKNKISANMEYCLQTMQKHRELAFLTKYMDVLAEIKVAMHGLLDAGNGFLGTPKIRTHQDYHLGQVLYVPSGDTFYVLDFEGEPGREGIERLEKFPPVRDVATMLRSFSYLKHFAFINYLEELLSIRGEERAAARTVGPLMLTGHMETKINLDEKVPKLLTRYEHEAGTKFIDGYLNTMSKVAPALLPCSAEISKLIKFWLMEKAVYELKYELEHRVENAGIPIAGMIEILYGSEKPWLRTGT